MTSLLGFGSGMLLGRLVDHAFGRKLTRQQLEDLAEYSSFSGRLWGAPELLHSADGVELIKSLNYVLARGGNPSPWRAQLVDAIAGPEHLRTLTETLPGWAKKIVARYANQITATIALVAGRCRVRVPADRQRWSRARSSSRWATTSSVGCRSSRSSPSSTSGIATLADKLPWSNPIRERRKKSGAAARERIAMLDEIARGRQIPLTFAHHDRSTSGEGFTG